VRRGILVLFLGSGNEVRESELYILFVIHTSCLVSLSQHMNGAYP